MVEIFQVDAFTDRLFGGNQAAVVPLEAWIDDKMKRAMNFAGLHPQARLHCVAMQRLLLPTYSLHISVCLVSR